jgi:hypothetical protein
MAIDRRRERGSQRAREGGLRTQVRESEREEGERQRERERERLKREREREIVERQGCVRFAEDKLQDVRGEGMARKGRGGR